MNTTSHTAAHANAPTPTVATTAATAGHPSPSAAGLNTHHGDATHKTDEKSSQHGKRAMMVALALGGLVLGGLLVDSLRNTGSNNAKPKTEDTQPISQGRDPFDDFEARQRAEQARLEAERRRRLAANTAVAAEQAASAAVLSPEQELRQLARLEDLKRALGALRSPAMITTGSASGGSARGAGMGAGMGAEPSKADATLVKLRQAIERARSGDAASTTSSAAGPLTSTFARDLQSAQASQAVVGQSGSARRSGGDKAAREGEYLLPVGSVLSGVLDMELNSDWEGRWRALLVRDVYDAKQQVILLPKGTRILGTTVRAKATVNEAINERMAMAANWLVLPNGARIDLSRSGTLDAAGVGAIEGDVNRHFLAQLGGVVAYGVIGGLGAVSAVNKMGPTAGSDAAGLSLGRSAGGEVAAGLVGIGQRVASRYLNLVPTITVKPGTPMTIFLDDEIFLNAWAPIDDVALALPTSWATRSASR